MNNLLAIAISHRTAPMSVRERLRVRDDQIDALAAHLRGVSSEQFVLTTCERFEVYLATSGPSHAACLQSVADFLAVSPRFLRGHARLIAGSAAANHLLRVAAGLDSRILGENEVLGQVRRAYRSAARGRQTGPFLSALLRHAIRAGKLVRTQAPVYRPVGSIADLAVQQLIATFDDDGTGEAVPLVIAGTGELAAAVLAAAHATGRLHPTVAGRTAHRARALAHRFAAKHDSLRNLGHMLARHRAVITCTSSPVPLLTPAMLAGRTNVLHAIDLAMPRNIDPQVAGVARVRLTSLDDLYRSATASVDCARQEAIVAAEVALFLRWAREREAAPQIAKLIESWRSTDAGEHSRKRLHREIMKLKRAVAA